MEAIIIHPTDKEQEDALLTILNGLRIPYEKEYADESERIFANPALTEKIEQSRKEVEEGKGVKLAIGDLWR